MIVDDLALIARVFRITEDLRVHRRREGRLAHGLCLAGEQELDQAAAKGAGMRIDAGGENDHAGGKRRRQPARACAGGGSGDKRGEIGRMGKGHSGVLSTCRRVEQNDALQNLATRAVW